MRRHQRIIRDPGKFEGESEIARDLYEASLDGFEDDQIGDVNEMGWYGRFNKENAILSEDDSGFVHVEHFKNKEQLDRAWKEIQAIYSQEDSEGF